MTQQDDIERIQQVYESDYRPDPTDRNYAWHPRNLISVYYRQAQERALIRLFNDFNLPLEKFTVLDVGCGGGGFLRFLASLGSPAANLHGLDLMPYRVEQAQQLCPPGVDVRSGNAAGLPYSDDGFDLVSQFTVFSSIFDGELKAQIAREMMRVLKPAGYLLWYDMQVGNTANTRAISGNEIRQLFPNAHIMTTHNIHPLRGTRLARRSRLLAELIDYIPGLPKTHILALLQKPTLP